MGSQNRRGPVAGGLYFYEVHRNGNQTFLDVWDPGKPGSRATYPIGQRQARELGEMLDRYSRPDFLIDPDEERLRIIEERLDELEAKMPTPGWVERLIAVETRVESVHRMAQGIKDWLGRYRPD